MSFGCSSPFIFGKKNPREKYEQQLGDENLEETVAGKQWLLASKTALEKPLSISLPYRHVGLFATDKPRALGLAFTAKKGERLLFSVAKKTPALLIFADLFRRSEIASPLLSVDTAANSFSFDVEESGSYVLRLQPQLFRAGEYELSISVGPSLAFPVGNNQGKTGSFWGDRRDGGKRRHEGIDIFAPKKTPAVAAADGVVTGVKEAGIGGKVVWLRLLEKNVTLYYAHLDKQLVKEGQAVKKGEVLGLVGNTGNARYTPSHLHFGVYTAAGPIDPFPFVNPAIKTAPDAANRSLVNYLRLIKTQKTEEDSLVKINTLLIPIAVASKNYIAELPNGRYIQPPFTSVQNTKDPIKQGNAMAATSLAMKDNL